MWQIWQHVWRQPYKYPKNLTIVFEPFARTLWMGWCWSWGFMGRIWADIMGIKSGGTPPRRRQISRGRPQKLGYFSIFLDTYKNFAFSNIFKIKWSKSDDKLDFGGRCIWGPMNLSPQTKLCGNAPGRYCIWKLIVRISVLSEVWPFNLFPQNGAKLHFNHGEAPWGTMGKDEKKESLSCATIEREVQYSHVPNCQLVLLNSAQTQDANPYYVVCIKSKHKKWLRKKLTEFLNGHQRSKRFLWARDLKETLKWSGGRATFLNWCMKIFY